MAAALSTGNVEKSWIILTARRMRSGCESRAALRLPSGSSVRLKEQGSFRMAQHVWQAAVWMMAEGESMGGLRALDNPTIYCMAKSRAVLSKVWLHQEVIKPYRAMRQAADSSSASAAWKVSEET